MVWGMAKEEKAGWRMGRTSSDRCGLQVTWSTPRVLAERQSLIVF